MKSYHETIDVTAGDDGIPRTWRDVRNLRRGSLHELQVEIALNRRLP